MIVNPIKSVSESFPWEQERGRPRVASRARVRGPRCSCRPGSTQTRPPSPPATFQTYFGMDVSAVEDPVQRRALETMIKTYGQTPRQLFQSAHVSRPGPKLSLEGELPAAVGLLVQLAFREPREPAREAPQPVGRVAGQLHGAGTACARAFPRCDENKLPLRVGSRRNFYFEIENQSKKT